MRTMTVAVLEQGVNQIGLDLQVERFDPLLYPHHAPLAKGAYVQYGVELSPSWTIVVLAVQDLDPLATMMAMLEFGAGGDKHDIEVNVDEEKQQLLICYGDNGIKLFDANRMIQLNNLANQVMEQVSSEFEGSSSARLAAEFDRQMALAIEKERAKEDAAREAKLQGGDQFDLDSLRALWNPSPFGDITED